MSRDNLKQLVKDLDWHLIEEVQEYAIEEIVKGAISNEIDLIELELFTLITKPMFVNYCKIVRRVGFPKNLSVIKSLLSLLMDMNWPGSLDAMKILESFGKDCILNDLEEAIVQAYNESDYMWLGGIEKLVTQMKIREQDFNDQNAYKLLEFADW